MTDHLKLYLFGDQTYDTQPRLKELLRHRDNPILEAFLEKTYDAIRVEIFNLPQDIKEYLPRFTSIEDLVLWSRSSKQYVPLDMVVTCIYQLGTFIV